MTGADDVVVQSGEGTLKLSSNTASNISAGSVVVSASNAEGVISLEAGARLDANAASTSIRATSQDGINIATVSSANDQERGSVTVSSSNDIDMEAQHTKLITSSGVILSANTSISMQSQERIVLTSSETSGSVDVVTQSLTTKNTKVSLSGSEHVDVKSSGGLFSNFK
jgi:hypothetical protein